jgi:hypothetical protein
LDGEQAIRDALADDQERGDLTRGPWRAKRLATYSEPGWVLLWPDNTKPGTHMRRLDYVGNFTEADARLIAACNPETMRALLSELDRLRSASRQEGWQPIETAPENGTFLVFMPEEHTQMQVAKWHPNVKTIGNSFAFDLSDPTHWHPLPAAPHQAQEAQGDRHGE